MKKTLQFIEKYNNPKNVRFESFYKSLLISYERKHKIIVETGTSRGKRKYFFFNKPNWKDGMSTLIFADYAKNINGKLYSCDLDSFSISSAKKFTKSFSDYVIFINCDSLLFLKNFNQKIDFLYLDSLDGHDPIKSSIHQLHEAESAINKLHNKSLVLLDDKGLKTNKSLDFFIKMKLKIINETNEQILLSF